MAGSPPTKRSERPRPEYAKWAFRGFLIRESNAPRKKSQQGIEEA